MLRDAVASWWLLQVRGLLAFAFGACLFFLAGIMQGRFTTTIALVGVFLAFVGYLIASGALFIFGALVSIGTRARFWAGVGAIMLALGLWLFLSDQTDIGVAGLVHDRQRVRIRDAGDRFFSCAEAAP